ncbi:MAG: hypothetical protein QM796_13095 [Chthoniobacteraceae bacterium]
MKLKLNNAFHCPEGKWRGTCEAIEEPNKRMNRPCSKQVRLRFALETHAGEKIVARTFCADLSIGGELHAFLDSWLDGNFDPYLDEDGEVDLDLLVGKMADLLITHGVKSEEYKFPLVIIAGLFPPGQLVEN